MSFGHKRGWEKRQEDRREFERKFHQEKRARMAGLPVQDYSDGPYRGFADTSTGFSQMTSATVYGTGSSFHYPAFGNVISYQGISTPNQVIAINGNSVMVAPANQTPVKMEPAVRAPSLREVWAD